MPRVAFVYTDGPNPESSENDTLWVRAITDWPELRPLNGEICFIPEDYWDDIGPGIDTVTTMAFPCQAEVIVDVQMPKSVKGTVAEADWLRKRGFEPRSRLDQKDALAMHIGIPWE